MHPDKKQAEKNIQYMIERLRLAEELEAATCVNILGTKQKETWFGPHKDGYTEDFFKEAVEVSRYIIDTVKPQRTKLSFEMMPYYFLDSPEAYVIFLNAVDRREAAKLPADTPAMLEHLETEDEYDKAAEAAVHFAESIGMHREGMVWLK